MGASVVAYWPGITEDDMESMPGFSNDDRAWGNWMAEREDDPPVLNAVASLKADAILTVKTDGWDDEDVAWVSPQQLRQAALALRVAVQTNAQEAVPILKSYERNANRVDPVASEFVRDLEDIVAMTKWAEARGAAKMTLEVNW
jgi:hypothetical protein